jgi:hypothetical protein
MAHGGLLVVAGRFFRAAAPLEEIANASRSGAHPGFAGVCARRHAETRSASRLSGCVVKQVPFPEAAPALPTLAGCRHNSGSPTRHRFFHAH